MLVSFSANILVHQVNKGAAFSTAAISPGIYWAKIRIRNVIVVKPFVKQ
jgi:hypothetical protein